MCKISPREWAVIIPTIPEATVATPAKVDGQSSSASMISGGCHSDVILAMDASGRKAEYVSRHVFASTNVIPAMSPARARRILTMVGVRAANYRCRLSHGDERPALAGARREARDLTRVAPGVALAASLMSACYPSARAHAGAIESRSRARALHQR